jgi:hypothetical protein
MQCFVKFWNLPAGERRLLGHALVSLAVVRIGLWVFPLQAMLRRLESLKMAPHCRVSDHLPPDRIAWAIRAVSRYLPGTRNCLVQALTAQRLLMQRGFPSQLRIGATRDAADRFRAHAWVEYAGRIVIGGAGAAQYTPFPDLNEG